MRSESDIAIRQAGLADIDALVPLFDAYRQFYGRACNLDGAREFLLARLNHNESTIFIAQDAGKAIGFAQLYPSFSSASLARTFILNDLFVDENSRKKGTGRQLITAAVEHARSLGAVRLTLSTAIDNETAQALYNTTGWKRDEQFIVYHYAI